MLFYSEIKETKNISVSQLQTATAVIKLHPMASFWSSVDIIFL